MDQRKFEKVCLRKMDNQVGEMRERPRKNKGKKIETDFRNTRQRAKTPKFMGQFCKLNGTQTLEDRGEYGMPILSQLGHEKGHHYGLSQPCPNC